jgi:hypothetical protein
MNFSDLSSQQLGDAGTNLAGLNFSSLSEI